MCLNTVWIAVDTDLNQFSIITNAPIEFQAREFAGAAVDERTVGRLDLRHMLLACQVAENFFCGYFFGCTTANGCTGSIASA